MLTIKIYHPNTKPDQQTKQEILDFLFLQLGRYGDPKHQIQKAMDYALKEYPSDGGCVFEARLEEELVGAAVLNQTGMSEYIPENILVYIATHKEYRGKGIGKQLMQKIIETTEGNIALHVDKDNPAIGLYEKLGFVQKYVEMRLNK